MLNINFLKQEEITGDFLLCGKTSNIKKPYKKPKEDINTCGISKCKNKKNQSSI